MVDMAAIGALSSALRSATDIAKAFIGLRDEALIQAKVIELQSAILSAQQSAFETQTTQSALLNEIAVLKERLAEVEGWSTERQRYALTQPSHGLFVYRLKAEAKGTEPIHDLCVRCFNDGKKAILQSQGNHLFTCHSCSSRFFPTPDIC